MNNKRRSEISIVLKDIKNIINKIQDIYDEECESFDGMPENLQGSENGAYSEECQEILDGVICDLETIIDDLGGI